MTAAMITAEMVPIDAMMVEAELVLTREGALVAGGAALVVVVALTHSPCSAKTFLRRD